MFVKIVFIRIASSQVVGCFGGTALIDSRRLSLLTQMEACSLHDQSIVININIPCACVLTQLSILNDILSDTCSCSRSAWQVSLCSLQFFVDILKVIVVYVSAVANDIQYTRV